MREGPAPGPSLPESHVPHLHSGYALAVVVVDRGERRPVALVVESFGGATDLATDPGKRGHRALVAADLRDLAEPETGEEVGQPGGKYGEIIALLPNQANSILHDAGAQASMLKDRARADRGDTSHCHDLVADMSCAMQDDGSTHNLTV